MIYDRIHQLTSTSGTGAYTLGSTVTGRLSVLDALTAEGVTPAGAKLHLWIIGDDDDDDFEEGIYTFDGVDQLTRTSIIRSSNADAAVNWGATAKNVISAPGGAYLRRLNRIVNCVVAGGTANALTAAPEVPIGALADGDLLLLRPSLDSGAGDVTLNPSGLGGKRVVQPDAASAGATVSFGATVPLGALKAGVLSAFSYAAADDRFTHVPLGSPNRALGDFKVVGDLTVLGDATIGGTAAMKAGLHTLSWPARALRPAETNGCARLAVEESATNKVNDEYLAFGPGAIEYALLKFRAPKSSDEAAGFTVEFEWGEAAGAVTHDCVWQVEMQAQGDGDTRDAAWGTAVTVTDTGSAGTRRFCTTGTVTPGGTWAAGDVILGRFSRKGTDGADTLDVNAHLYGVSGFITLAAGNDA